MTDLAAADWRDRLSPVQEGILRTIASAGEWGRPRAQQTLQALHRRGLIKRGKRGGTYRLTRMGQQELARL